MTKRHEKAVELAKTTMKGDLRDVALDIMRVHLDWKHLKEEDQRNIVQQLETKIEASIVKAVDIIAAEGRRSLKVLLKQVTVKDGLKINCEASKISDMRHDLIDAQGDTVLIVLKSSSHYMGQQGKVKYDKNQPDLPLKEATDGEQKEIPHDKTTGEVIEEAAHPEDAAHPGEDAEGDEAEGDEEFDDGFGEEDED